MSDVRSEVKNILSRVKFEDAVVAELKDAISTASTRGNAIGKIIDDPKLSNEEKAVELSASAMRGPGGTAGAIVIGIIIGILL